MRLSAVVLLLALAASVSACSADDPEPQPQPDPARAAGEPTATVPRYGHYVALGDSYTAAPLVPPTDTTTTCLRSKRNYPAWVVEGLPGTRLTDVSCGGATTADTTGSQRGATGSVPPQFDALRRGTDLVTIALGGNDEGLFGSMIVRCTRLAEHDPSGSPCADTLGDRAPVLERIRDNLAAVVAGVRERSPDARILLVGYPQIVPDEGTCADLPLAAGDYPFVRDVNEGLSQAVEDAAADADAEYVDVWTASEDRDICADEPWINGRLTQFDRALAYHPLAEEQRAVAELVLEAIG